MEHVTVHRAEEAPQRADSAMKDLAITLFGLLVVWLFSECVKLWKDVKWKLEILENDGEMRDLRIRDLESDSLPEPEEKNV